MKKVAMEAVTAYFDGKGSAVYKDAHGFRHNTLDRPAVDTADGVLKWYRHGDIHREGDKPAQVDALGNAWWFKDGVMHRDHDQPAAMLCDGTMVWFCHGQCHRWDGPAYIDSHGNAEWWMFGEYICGGHIEATSHPRMPAAGWPE